MMTQDALESQSNALLRRAGASRGEYPAYADEDGHIRRSESPCGLDIRVLDFVAEYRANELSVLLRSVSLTDRQKEVLRYKRLGYRWSDVARMLGVSRQTVYRDVATMAGVVTAGRRDGLLQILIDVFGWRAVSDALNL